MRAADRALTVVVCTLVLVSCAPLPSPSPPSSGTSSVETCPEAAFSTLPPGFVADPPVLVGGSAPYGVSRTYRDSAGRDLSVLSGINAREAGGTDTGARVTVRGHMATIEKVGDTYVAFWREGAEGARCSEYAVFGTGFDLSTFLQLLSGVR